MKKSIKHVAGRRIASIIMSAVLGLAGVGVLPQTALPVHAANGQSALQMTTSNITGAQASSVYFGNYHQSSDGQGGYNIDPIKWRVLQNANGQLLLLADQNLDAKKYNTAYTSITWENCTLRTWLNGTSNGQFLNDAFSVKEQAVIVDTVITNSDNPDYGTSGGNNTTDKVFLLSVDEVKNTTYGFTDNYSNTDTRVATNTAYVAALPSMSAAGSTDIWWLRSPGSSNETAAIVSYNGNVDTDGLYVANSDVAVHPAINLNLSSVIFTSAAAGGKSSGTAGADELTPIADDYTGTAWKLTLLDDGSTNAIGNSHAGFTASRVGTGNVQAGDAITVSYSGAKTGANEYVSAIIVSASNENVPLYYGRIANNCASGTGTDITIPAGLNGDYKTDYVSAFTTIDFTIESTSASGTSTPGTSGTPSTPSVQPSVIEETKPLVDPMKDVKEKIKSCRFQHNQDKSKGNITVVFKDGTVIEYEILDEKYYRNVNSGQVYYKKSVEQ